MKNNEKKKPGSPGTTKQVTLAQADQITVLLVPQEALGHPGTALQESGTIREVAMKGETSNPPCSNLVQFLICHCSQLQGEMDT